MFPSAPTVDYSDIMGSLSSNVLVSFFFFFFFATQKYLFVCLEFKFYLLVYLFLWIMLLLVQLWKQYRDLNHILRTTIFLNQLLCWVFPFFIYNLSALRTTLDSHFLTRWQALLHNKVWDILVMSMNDNRNEIEIESTCVSVCYHEPYRHRTRCVYMEICPYGCTMLHNCWLQMIYHIYVCINNNIEIWCMQSISFVSFVFHKTLKRTLTEM